VRISRLQNDDDDDDDDIKGEIKRKIGGAVTVAVQCSLLLLLPSFFFVSSCAFLWRILVHCIFVAIIIQHASVLQFFFVMDINMPTSAGSSATSLSIAFK
jgi:hypothetical protein